MQEDRTLIEMVEPVNLTFALRYLINFSKATSLAPSVVSEQQCRSLAQG